MFGGRSIPGPSPRGLPSSERRGWDQGQSEGRPATNLIDPDVEPGKLWHYAVFSVRSGKASHTAARLGPFVVTRDVDDLRAEASDGQITLRWKWPPNARRIEIAAAGRGAAWHRPGVARFSVMPGR